MEPPTAQTQAQPSGQHPARENATISLHSLPNRDRVPRPWPVHTSLKQDSFSALSDHQGVNSTDLIPDRVCIVISTFCSICNINRSLIFSSVSNGMSLNSTI